MSDFRKGDKVRAFDDMDHSTRCAWYEVASGRFGWDHNRAAAERRYISSGRNPSWGYSLRELEDTFSPLTPRDD